MGVWLGLARIAAAGTVGWGATGLALALMPAPPAERVEAATSAGVAADARTPMPPLFGTPPPPEPEVVRATAYTLRGLMAAGSAGWALVAGPSGEALVRPGDVLPGGETVAAITAEGVRIEGPAGPALIAFDGEDLPASAPPDTPAGPVAIADAGAGPAPAARDFAMPAESLSPNGLVRELAPAGGLALVDLPDGTRGQEVLWVRPGRLYDRMGLQEGDVVRSINGVPAGDEAALRDNYARLLGADAWMLEIQRGSQRLRIRVVPEDA